MLPSLAAMLMGSTASLAAPVSLPAHSFHDDHVLGTSLDVTLVSGSEEMAALAMQAIRAEIARLDPILSGWRSDSELMTLNQSRSHAASAELYDVVAAGEAWRQTSGGAFNLGLGTLAAAAPEARPALAARLQQASLTLEPQSRTITRPEGVQLAIDGIAKGYIIDRALEAARRVPGIQGAMIDIGGDLRCWGASPDGAGWRIGVANPQDLADNAAPCATIRLQNAAVASSGAGARAHAILDPATGAMRSDVLMATAVAPTAADADALATIFHVLPSEQSLALADSLPGVAAHVVGADGTAHASQGWVQLAQNGAPRPSLLAPAWPVGFSLKIDYEIPVITGGRRVHVPYISIWVTNAAGEPVRALANYADKPRFMPENYVFWDKVGGANPALVTAVTRPTRPPGAYSISWDGRDDAGKPVPQGRYTINVEASREHGGHNIQRIDIDLGAAPANGGAGVQQEIGTIKVTYGK
jgi:thiamine biosynthesis lipoprotein